MSIPSNKLKKKADEIAGISSPTEDGASPPKAEKKTNLVMKRPAPVRYMSSHALKLGSLKKFSSGLKSDETDNISPSRRNRASSTSINANIGD